MRRPTRSPFHHSDLGGAFGAFAPGFHEGGEDVKHEPDTSHPLFTPTRHQRSSVLSMLIDALSHRRWRLRHRDFVVPGKRSRPP